MNMPTKWKARRWVLLAPVALTMAGANETKLAVREPGEANRAPAAITTGIPFARGAVKDAAVLAASLNGKAVPAQFRAHVPWDDGSVRWALMDTQVPVEAGQSVEIAVAPSGGGPAPAAPVTVDENNARIRVSTGSLAFEIPKQAGGLVSAATLKGQSLLTGDGRGAVLVLKDGKEVVAGAPQEAVVETAGPMRTVVRVRGVFPGVHNDLIRYTARITAWAGQPRIGIRFWLENHGAMGHGEKQKHEWFQFKSMSLELGLGLGGTITARCEDVEAQDSFRLLQRCLMAKDRKPQGPSFTLDDFVYTVVSGGKELKKDDRTAGIVRLTGDKGGLTVGIREFWENYDKAIELKKNRLLFWLWPEEGQWPRPKRGRWERAGLNCNDLVRIGDGNNAYWLSGGLHKGHDMILDFSDAAPETVAAELNTPLFALASSEHFAATKAAPGLFAPAGVRVEKNREANFKLASWERMQRSASDPDSPVSIFAARKVSWRANIGYWGANSHWYGWMDFGDISVPGRGQVGVDGWSQLMFENAMRFGDVHAMKIGSQMARHIADVDQLWSDRDRPQYRGLQKRGVLPEFHANRLDRGIRVGNRLGGLALHYMLTGDPKSKEACLRNGDGLIAAWNVLSKSEAYGSPQLHIGRNANTISSYTTLYHLTADKKWLDAAMGLFDSHIRRLWKSHGPHLHSANQIRGQGYARQDEAFCLAIQFLCEFHHATQNADALKLLQEACEREFHAHNFFDAPTYLAGLFGYVGGVTGNRDYLVQGARLYAESFPESRSPPVFMPNNSRWHSYAGSMLRAGHLLQYGWWRSSR